ncbi:hypothetical protein V8C37DRAFT_371375 [Trichoderma ceciliae]
MVACCVDIRSTSSFAPFHGVSVSQEGLVYRYFLTARLLFTGKSNTCMYMLSTPYLYGPARSRKLSLRRLPAEPDGKDGIFPLLTIENLFFAYGVLVGSRVLGKAR